MKDHLLTKSVFRLVVAILVVYSHDGYGQQRGVISGRVLDAMTEQPLVGANVIIVGTTLGAAADAEGRFRIEGLAPGTYVLRTTMVGYAPAITSDVVVTAVKPASVEIRLMEMLIDVSTVEVVAAPFRRMPEAPLSNFTQTSEEIRRLPGGFEDVVRAISILPGVAQAEPGRNDLVVRGGAPSENLYVVNNIELPTINHFGTQGIGGGPLSFINLDFVRSTSFSTGGFGVPYGDRLSSVLDIRLLDGRTDRLGGKATLSATQFGLNLEGPPADNGSLIFSARRSYLDLFFKAAGFAFVPEYWDFLLSGSQKLSQADNLSYLGIVVWDNVRLFNDTPDKRFENSRILASDQRHYVGGVSWQHLLPGGYTRLTFSRIETRYRSRQNDSLLVPIFQNTSRETELAVRADALYQFWKGFELSGGVQVKRLSLDAGIDLDAFIPNLQQQLRLQTSLVIPGTKTAAYLQASQLFGNLRVTLGGRLDAFSLLQNPTAWTARAGVSYMVSPGLSLNLSAGDYVQAPSLIWMVANPANRQLRHLRAQQFVAGMDIVPRDDTKLTLEVFAKRYRDYPASVVRPYLVLANTGAGFGGAEDGFASFGFEPLVSSGSGLSRGVEFFVQKKFSDVPCYGTVSVSYTQSEFRALDEIVRPGSFDQRWIVNLGGGYVFDEHWEVSGRFRLATGRPYTPYTPAGTLDLARYNAARLRTNHSLDLRVDRRWHFESWVLITYLDIQNIYNRKPVTLPRFNARTGQPEEGRAIGILPSIGVSAEF